MGIAKMSRVYLVAHQSEKEKVLDVLQQSGLVEISDLQAKDAEPTDWWELVEGEEALPELQELEARLGEVRFAQDFLARYYPEKKGMLEALSAEKLTVSAGELEEQAEKWAKTAREVYAALRKVDERLVALRSEETRLQNLKAQLAPWVKLAVPVEELKSTATVRVEVGVLPAGGLAKAREELLSAVPTCYLEEVDKNSNEAYVVVVCHHRDGELVQSILKQHNFNRQGFGDLSGTVAENLKLVDEGLARLEKERQEALELAAEQVKYREQLNYYSDYLSVEKEKAQATANFARTNNTFVLEGWTRTADLPRLEKLLAASCETVEMMSEEPGEDEDFPVLLENHRAIVPFEFITKLYGTPHPRGIDPTLALTPFFVIFFGLCMTDAGYGAVLAVVAALALWKLKPKGALHQLLWIMVAGGISTLVFGHLVGGWFGASAFGSPLFFDAMAEPMTMLIYALALGVIQIFVGMGIKMFMNIKAGKWQEVIYDDLLWYTIMIGILLFGLLPAAKEVGKWMTIVGAVGLSLTQGRSHRNIIKRFFSGVLSLYNLTGWLSDVLSYSRLLALGLATGVIALAVNTMAGLLSGPILLPVKIVLLFIGHSFNLVINALGSFVHSCRLQYIEYYGRFYEAGGRAFSPFALKTRYMQVVPEWTEEN